MKTDPVNVPFHMIAPLARHARHELIARALSTVSGRTALRQSMTAPAANMISCLTTGKGLVGVDDVRRAMDLIEAANLLMAKSGPDEPMELEHDGTVLRLDELVFRLTATVARLRVNDPELWKALQVANIMEE